MYSAIWAYPWDLLDEGLDGSLGRIADAGLDAVSVAAAYHSIRALCPHNPRRAVYHGEGGVIYFHPDSSLFEGSALKPVISELADETDPLVQICAAAAARNLKVHAWTVLHHNTRLGTEHPDCAIENAFGDRYPFGLCPANPDVRAYSLGLVGSLAARDDVDTIELESLGYMGIDHSGHHAKAGISLDELHRFLLSICFCPYCSSHMSAHEVNVEQSRERVVTEMRSFFNGRFQQAPQDTLAALTDVLGPENADGVLAARDEVVLTLLEDIYWQVKSPQKLSVMVTASPMATGAQTGVTLSVARDFCDRMLTQAFERDAARLRDRVGDVAVRRGSRPLFAGVQAVEPFVGNAGELRAGIIAARDAGAEGIQFYHYGLMPLQNLTWVSESLAALA